MSIQKMSEHIALMDWLQESAYEATEDVLEKFDEAKALKHGKKYIKAFAKKFLDPVLIKSAKHSYEANKE